MYHEACQKNGAINCIPVNADKDFSEQQLKTAVPGVETKEAWRVKSAVARTRLKDKRKTLLASDSERKTNQR